VRRLALAACLVAAAWGAPPYRLAVPKGFPQPKIPPGNPLTADKVRLGRYLFYDKRLSVNGAASCGTCHRQELAFTDSRAQAVGATGQTLPRGTMSLVNVAYAGALTWSNPDLHSLEELAFGAIFAADGVVMNKHGRYGPASIRPRLFAQRRHAFFYSRIRKLGIERDQVVQEWGWDEDTDDDIRAAVEETCGAELLDEDTDEMVDVVVRCRYIGNVSRHKTRCTVCCSEPESGVDY